MGTDTTYKISILYETRDKASKPLDAIAGASGRAANSASGLGSALQAVTGALAGFGALRMGKSLFVDFNSSIEQSNIGLAAQEMMLKGGTWDAAMQHANTLFGDYQQVAKASVGETKDFLEMHQQLAGSAMKAGMSMKQVEDLTIGATIAAAAFGRESREVGLDVQQMLAGTVGARDRFAQMMLASQHITQDAFNKMPASQRAKVTMAAMNDPSLKAAAKQMEGTYAGVVSTLKDNLSIAMAKIGLPLFKGITAEIKKWNEWIDKNPEKIRQFAADFSDALSKGFEMVKGVAGFLVEHKDLLMSLAKAWLVGKGVGMVTGSVQGIAGALTALTGTGAGSFGAFGLSLNGVTLALGVVAATASAVADKIDENQTAKIDAGGTWSVAAKMMSDERASDFGIFTGRDQDYMRKNGMGAAQERLDERMLSQATAQGFIVGGKVQKSRIEGTALTAGGIGNTEIEDYIARLEKLNTAERRLSMARERSTDIALHAGQSFLWWSQNMTGFVDLIGALNKSRDSANKAYQDIANPTKAPPINIQINMTDDPDRFSVAFDGFAMDAAKNPRGAATAWRGA